MTRKVYVPNPAGKILEEAKKQLYLLKTALAVGTNEEKLQDRIDNIRMLLVEVEDLMSD